MKSWTFAILVEKVPTPPAFAPEAQLVCRIVSATSIYCVPTVVEEQGDRHRVSARIEFNEVEKELPRYEFGWIADSAFMSLV